MNKARILLAMLIVSAVATACHSKISDIEVKSCALESVSLTGLRSASAQVGVCIDNPAMQLTLFDVEGTVYYKDKPYLHITTDPVTIYSKITRIYHLKADLALNGSVSMLEVLSLVNNMNMSDMYMSLKVKVKPGKGPVVPLNFKKIPFEGLK